MSGRHKLKVGDYVLLRYGPSQKPPHEEKRKVERATKRKIILSDTGQEHYSRKTGKRWGWSPWGGVDEIRPCN